ncbi:hypothetical protein FRB91_011121 [Serendipita sp. 411]|nr:hypothetical protein FRC18_002077 [Serendipita sp. 400]KAG8848166.1 hypothetical protein FRB91_011121 [Serendipita sp. 411]
MSSQSPRRQSEEFPENYGDFQLISSDGVVFSISRFLLSYVSPVFKDMLELGGEITSGVAEIQLTESSVTLDQLLRFFDPLKDPAPIDTKTMEPLLESARKYQIEGVFKYWEDQMVYRNKQKQITTVYSPLACFALASRFGRHEMTRTALRELLRAPSKELQAPVSTTAESGVMQRLLQLRLARLQKMRDRIAQVQESIQSGTRCGNVHVDVVQSILKLTLQLMDEPSWSTFQRNTSAWGRCDAFTPGRLIRHSEPGLLGQGACILSPTELFNIWKSEILAEELKLPELSSSF